MNYTSNYSLPQWAEDDRIMMEDFNGAFARVEKMGYKVGSYVGNGVEFADGGQFIELGFKPRFVIFSKGSPSCETQLLAQFMLTEHQLEGAKRYASLGETGFTVGEASGVSNAFRLNVEGNSYSFIAFQ